MDDEAIGELLDAGYRYAMALCHHEAQAADLVQEAWLAILRAGKRKPSKAYLFRAIKSKHIDHHRSATERYREAGTDPTAASSATVENQDPQLAEDLEEAIGQLRVEEREAVVLMLVEGCSAATAGRLLGKSRNTILSLVHRSKDKLRQRLQAWWSEAAS